MKGGGGGGGEGGVKGGSRVLFVGFHLWTEGDGGVGDLRGMG